MVSSDDNVCLYLRKSRADREAELRGEGETLARHEKILLNLAKKHGYTVGAIYKEVVSGETIQARPVMQQLLREVEAGMWDGVLVVEVERLARGDTIDQGIVSRAFQYSDTKIITPLKIYNPNNEFDEEYFEFGLFMSRREYKTIKRRLNSGRLSSVREGKYVGNKPPYGYKRVKLEHDKGFTLQPIPEQAEIVKLIYNWYVYGIDGENIGVSKIVRRLNTMGIPALNRPDWVPASVQGILSNPVYIGKIRWNHRKAVRNIQNGSVIISRPRSTDYILSDGLHPAIIEESLYYKAQEIRHKNPPRPIGFNKEIKNPLSGLVYCSQCGRAMIRRPSKVTDDILMCPYGSCNTVSSKLTIVEHGIISGISEMVKNYKLSEDFDTCLQSGVIETKKRVLKDKQAELKHLSDQKKKQYELLEQEIYTTEIFLERSKDIARRLQECTNSIETIEKEIEHDEAVLSQRSCFIPKCEYLLSDYWDLDIPVRNKVLKELLEKVVYSKDKRNPYGKADMINFALDIYPKVNSAPVNDIKIRQKTH